MFKTLWPYLRGYKKELILGPLFKLSEAVIETLLPFLIARLIDLGINAGNRGFIINQTLWMLLLVVFAVIFAFSCQYMSSVCSQGFGTNLRTAIVKKISHASQEDTQHFGQSSLLVRSTLDINQLQLAIAMTIRLVSRAPFLTVGSLIMGLIINTRLALLMLAAIPVAAYALWLIMQATVRVYRVVQLRLDKVTGLIRDNLSGSKVIRAFAREGHERRFFAAKNLDLTRENIRSGKIAALMNPVTSLIFNGVIVLVLWRGGLLVNVGQLTQGEVFAFIGYQTQLVNAMMVVAMLFMQFPKAFTAGKRVAEVLAYEAEEPQAVVADPYETSEALLDVKDLAFTYPGSHVSALEGISFSLKKGETLGVIGATGSGKSTLAALLLHFFRSDRGELHFDGRDIESLDEHELRQRIAYVPQKASLLAGTIRSNLLLGQAARSGNYSDERLWAALRLAQAEDFVAEKEGGLDAVVERGGVNFSGGQKQRLSLARAVLHDFDLLILDDATSGLDYLTDYKFRKALAPLVKEKAVVFISQRVHVVKNAARILVLDDGKQMALGTHRELLKTSELYREIASSQLEREVRNGADL